MKLDIGGSWNREGLQITQWETDRCALKTLLNSQNMNEAQV